MPQGLPSSSNLGSMRIFSTRSLLIQTKFTVVPTTTMNTTTTTTRFSITSKFRETTTTWMTWTTQLNSSSIQTQRETFLTLQDSSCPLTGWSILRSRLRLNTTFHLEIQGSLLTFCTLMKERKKTKRSSSSQTYRSKTSIKVKAFLKKASRESRSSRQRKKWSKLIKMMNNSLLLSLSET